MNEEQIKEEYQKCKDSPYYFATTYLMVNGEKFSTHLTEAEFNDMFFTFGKEDIRVHRNIYRLKVSL